MKGLGYGGKKLPLRNKKKVFDDSGKVEHYRS